MDEELLKKAMEHPNGAAFLELIKQAQRDWGIDLEYVRDLGGKSGALVLHVDANPSNPAQKPSLLAGSHVLKLDKRDESGADEKTRHQHAVDRNKTFAKRHIPRLLESAQRESSIALLYQFAKGVRLQELGDLNCIDAADYPDYFKRFAGELITGLNPPKMAPRRGPKLVAISTFLSEWLGDRLKVDRNQCFRDFVRRATRGQARFHLRGGFMGLDPLWLCHDAWSRQQKQGGVRGFLHMDLHVNNILFPTSRACKGYWLIDFAKSCDRGLLGYDHAYFEFSFLLQELEKNVGLKEDEGVDRLLTILQRLEDPDDDDPRLQDVDLKVYESLSKFRNELVRKSRKLTCLNTKELQTEFAAQLQLARVAAGLTFLHRYAGDKPGQKQSSLKRDVVCWLAFSYAACAAQYFLSQHHSEKWRGLPLPPLDAVRIPSSGAVALHKERQFQETICRLSWSPGGGIIALVEDDKPLLWHWEENRLDRPPSFPTSGVVAVTWSPDGDKLAFGLTNSCVRIFDAKVWKELPGINRSADAGPVVALAWSKEDTLAVASCYKSSIDLWTEPIRETGNWNLSTVLSGHKHSEVVRTLAWSLDGKLLASGASDRDCIIWTDPLGTWERRELRGHVDEVNTVAWNPDGTKLASGANEKTIRVWVLRPEPVEVKPLDSGGRLVSCVAFSPDGQLLVFKGDRAVHVWRCDPWAHFCDIPEEASFSTLTRIGFHPSESSLLATLGDWGHSVRIWKLA